MASRSLPVALCFFAFYWQTRSAAAYPTQLPGDCTLSFKLLEASTLKDMPAGLNTAPPQKRMWRKGWAKDRAVSSRIAAWGRAAHISWSPWEPQLDQSVTSCCVWLMHSTVTSSGSTGVELHLCKSFWNHQRDEGSKEERRLNHSYLPYFTFSTVSIQTKNTWVTSA